MIGDGFKILNEQAQPPRENGGYISSIPTYRTIQVQKNENEKVDGAASKSSCTDVNIWLRKAALMKAALLTIRDSYLSSNLKMATEDIQNNLSFISEQSFDQLPFFHIL